MQNERKKMSAVHPIEQLVTCRGSGSRIAFNRKVCQLLADNEDIVLEAAREGVTILAQSEIDLIAPQRTLRAAFGSAVRFSPPTVRLLYEDGWQQPVMGFRIATPSAHLPQVERSLTRRSAAVFDIEARDGSAVVRGQAALATLLGYPRILRRLTRGTGHATLWLSHFEPLWSYSSETMACYQE
jgi:translation elongation factor EF-G